MEKINILIVEDEAIVSLDLADRLEGMGYTVAGTAASGEAALRIFAQQPVDIVLMDIHIQGPMDGIDTALKIRELRPVPLIYLTAQTDGPTVERAKATFPSAYLAKPFDEKNLQLAIEMALHNFAFQTPASPLAKPEMSAPIVEKISLNADNILRTEAAIFIKQNYKFVKFKPEDLLYCQADGVYTDLFTKEKKYTLRLTLQQVVDKLQFPPLVRVHRSYAVNRSNIDSFTDQDVTVGSMEIPIGASFREEFLGGFLFS
ncbi:MAG: response regulator [Saprospiraceae bacterium]|nr:response regulator [Saprospiraceae bacterium]